MITGVRKFLTDESGQDIVEYTLLLILFAGLALIYLSAMGTSPSGLLGKIADKVADAGRSLP